MELFDASAQPEGGYRGRPVLRRAPLAPTGGGGGRMIPPFPVGAPRDSRLPRARQPLRSLGVSITSPVSILRRVTIGGHYTFHPGTAGIAELSNGGRGGVRAAEGSAPRMRPRPGEVCGTAACPPSSFRLLRSAAAGSSTVSLRRERAWGTAGTRCAESF